MTDCDDYRRHEVWCRHGCSGRLCPDCARTVGLKGWPDLRERMPGPPDGLDALEILRALR